MGYQNDEFFEDKKRLNTFDKFCCVLAALLGVIFLILGCFGVFAGARAHFTLPPVLGIVPAFVGWGILKSIYVSW